MKVRVDDRVSVLKSVYVTAQSLSHATTSIVAGSAGSATLWIIQIDVLVKLHVNRSWYCFHGS